MSQLENAMQMKKSLEKSLSAEFDFANARLLETTICFHNQKVLEFKKEHILVNILGIKRYSDMNIEDLQELENLITVNLINDEAVKSELNNQISTIKTKLLSSINEFIFVDNLYNSFSDYFNIQKQVNSYVLGKKIQCIFQQDVYLVNTQNLLEIKKYNELDLLTLSAIYDIITNYVTFHFK